MIVLPSSVAGQALLRSHVAVRQVFAFDSAGSPLYGGLPLPIVGGSISWTWTDAVRCTASLILPATADLVPQAPGDLLGIGLNRLDVYMGTPGQTARVAQLYVKRVTRRRPEGTLSVEAADAASRVADVLYDGTPFPVDSTGDGSFYWNSAKAVIEGVLRDATGDATLTIADPDGLGVLHFRPYESGVGWASIGTLLTWGLSEFGANYAAELVNICDRIGGYLYPDADGTWTLAQDPGAPGTPVLTLATGPGGTVVQIEDGFDRKGVAANHYLVLAKAWDTGSVTDETADVSISGDYSPANIGRIDRYVECVNWGAGWANYRASELVARVAPALRTWTIDAVPYPGLEPGDTITLDETATGGGTTDLMVDTVTIPFDLERTMTLLCRNAPIT